MFHLILPYRESRFSPPYRYEVVRASYGVNPHNKLEYPRENKVVWWFNIAEKARQPGMISIEQYIGNAYQGSLVFYVSQKDNLGRDLF